MATQLGYLGIVVDDLDAATASEGTPRLVARRRSRPRPSRLPLKPVLVDPGRSSVTAIPLPRSSTRSASFSRSSAALAAA